MTRHTVVIQRPIEDVFAVLTDVELTGRWYPTPVEEWWTSAPPHGVGSTRRARVRIFGRAVENDAVVTAYEAPRLAAMRGLGWGAPFEVTLRFAPHGAGTRVDVDAALRFRGPMRLIGPLFAPAYNRGWQRGLHRLKELMESGEL